MPNKSTKSPKPQSKIGSYFRWCPPGQYRAGEKKVSIRLTRGYWLSECEITQQQWSDVTGQKPWDSHGKQKGPNHAANYITYGDAIDFVKKKNGARFSSLPRGSAYVIPSEALWEYACRAGTTTKFYFGDDDSLMTQHGWFGGKLPAEVGLKKPNPWGFHDMYGNIGEIVLDRWTDEPAAGIDPFERGGQGSGMILRGLSSTRGTTYRKQRNPFGNHGDEGIRLAIASSR